MDPMAKVLEWLNNKQWVAKGAGLRVGAAFVLMLASLAIGSSASSAAPVNPDVTTSVTVGYDWASTSTENLINDYDTGLSEAWRSHAPSLLFTAPVNRNLSIQLGFGYLWSHMDGTSYEVFDPDRETWMLLKQTANVRGARSRLAVKIYLW